MSDLVPFTDHLKERQAWCRQMIEQALIKMSETHDESLLELASAISEYNRDLIVIGNRLRGLERKFTKTDAPKEKIADIEMQSNALRYSRYHKLTKLLIEKGINPQGK